jgi:sec-independent protein translocase protein TatA
VGSLSPWHWAILAVVLVLLFGAKRLPDAARSLGKSMRIFKSEIREMQTDSKTDTKAETPSIEVAAPAPAPVQPAADSPVASEQGHTEARPA